MSLIDFKKNVNAQTDACTACTSTNFGDYSIKTTTNQNYYGKISKNLVHFLV